MQLREPPDRSRSSNHGMLLPAADQRRSRARKQQRRLSPSSYREAISSNVRFMPPISGRFVRSHRLRPDSAKTYGDLVLETACRKTDEFPVPVTAALIGPFLTRSQKGLRFWEKGRVVTKLAYWR